MAQNSFRNASVAAAFAAAMVITVPWIAIHEGVSLESYADYGGVWTVCYGDTIGVKAGDKKTTKECQDLLKTRTGQFMAKVGNLLTVPVTPDLLASHTSFSYNIGIKGYSTSQTLILTNQGWYERGCRAMMNWHTAGGHDCRLDKGKKNGCYGLIVRRQKEIDMCLKGIP